MDIGKSNIIRQVFFVVLYIVMISMFGILYQLLLHRTNNTRQAIVVSNRLLPFRDICKHPHHKSYTDCYNQLIRRNWVPECKVCNTMICTRFIRRNNDRTKYYNIFLNDLNILFHNYQSFPENCRNIGSYLTNIVQCSQNFEEAAWAQAVNSFIQMEKNHIAFSAGIKPSTIRTEDQFKEVKIFEPLIQQRTDLFANVFNRDMQRLKAFPLVYELYRRGLINLLKEPRTITYQTYYTTNAITRKAIDNLIQYKKFNE